MNTILLLFFLLFSIEKDPITDLIGKWKLVQIDKHGVIITPKKKDYYLIISPKSIRYNLEINRCETDSFSIDEKNIILYNFACTEICCDDQLEPISIYLNYSGTYQLKDSLLTIFNKKETLFLKKLN